MREGWEVKTLGEITKKIGSGATPRGGKTAYKASGIPLIRSLNVHDALFKEKNLAFIDDIQAEKLSNVIVQNGDVLLNITGASIARCCVAPQMFLPARVNQHVSIIRPKPELANTEFLAYLLISKECKDLLLQTGDKAGATRQALTKVQLQEFEIPLPPLAEQKRIVALLDQAFEGIELALAAASKNLKNARELFETTLNTTFTQKGEGWVETTLGEQIKLLVGHAFKSKEYTTSSEGVNLLRGDNIVQGSFRWKDVKKWPTNKVSEFDRFSLFANDVVLAMDRTWVKAGIKFAKVSEDELPCLLVQRVACLRALESLNAEYLYFLIGSKLFESYVLSIQTGLGVPHISGKQIQAFSFQLPELRTQLELVERLSALSTETQRLEALYQQKIDALNELKQSLLQKAFAGELTAQAQPLEATG